jgi:pyruvate dehydrogenase E2 component (dihydrolipoamide acetyltransferase)
MIEFKLPSLGADMDEGKLLEWKIKPGDRVARGQIVAVVDTSKAAVDIESWQEGTVHALLVQPEQTIAVGTVMALYTEPGAAAPAAAPPPTQAPARQASAPAVPAAAPPPSPAPASAATAAAVTPELAPARTRISPAARQRAAELQIAIDMLGRGSGELGAITLADVERAAQSLSTSTPAVPAAKPAATPARTDERALQMRRTIAAALSRSKREIPHYYLSEPIPMRRCLDWLAAENAARPIARRLLLAAPLLKAVAVCLKSLPELNGWYRNDAFTPSTAIHVGVAISLRQGGLVAPALHDVPAQNLDQLMAALADLIQRTRSGRLRSSELSDGTVTVTSLGEQGVQAVQGVIYPPQVALVGFGRVAEQAWAANGALMAMPVLTASLAADHRVSDGHRGARFLAMLRELLQQPEQLSEPT